MVGRYMSTKVFENFSVAIRQHKAQHSHCKLLHGYALKIKVWFVSNDPINQLDDMNWIVDFGGFKTSPQGNGLKDWLDNMFDHTLIIEKDDPYIEIFEGMEQFGLCKLVIVDQIGAEAMAKLIFDKFNDVLSKTDSGRCKVIKVEFWEDPAKNSAVYELVKSI